jgi:hypothetical protein
MSSPPAGFARLRRAGRPRSGSQLFGGQCANAPPILELVFVPCGKVARGVEVLGRAVDHKLALRAEGILAPFLDERDGKVRDVVANPTALQLLRGVNGRAAAESVAIGLHSGDFGSGLVEGQLVAEVEPPDDLVPGAAALGGCLPPRFGRASARISGGLLGAVRAAGGWPVPPNFQLHRAISGGNGEGPIRPPQRCGHAFSIATPPSSRYCTPAPASARRTHE